MKNLIKFLSLTLVIVLISFNSLNEKKPHFISCEGSFHINSLTLDLCNNSGQFFHKIAQNPGQAEHLNGWLNRLKNHFKELSDENKTNIECNE